MHGDAGERHSQKTSVSYAKTENERCWPRKMDTEWLEMATEEKLALLQDALSPVIVA